MANGLMYVNVHTVANGGGEVRGQIHADGNGNGGDEDD
jgi:CHRD domain